MQLSILRYKARFFPVILASLFICGCTKTEKKPANSPLPGKEGVSRTKRIAKFEVKERISARPATSESKTSEEAKPSESFIPARTDQEQVENALGEPDKNKTTAWETTDTSPDLEEEEEENYSVQTEMEYIRNLGAPLVDRSEDLRRVHPIYPVWIDMVNKQVVMLGVICQTDVPLEMFACLRGTKEHESIVAVPTEAFIVHGALLAIGAKPGAPVQYAPNYLPASGTEIEVTVRWKNRTGEMQSARAQDWVRNLKTGRALDQPWVFAGSGFWRDDSTGKEYYKAEGGDFICVANFPSAMLDLPIRSSESNAELLFQAFTERIPPRGTPVTLILTPRIRLTNTPEVPLPTETYEMPTTPMEQDEIPIPDYPVQRNPIP
jgi:hypothetical protein